MQTDIEDASHFTLMNDRHVTWIPEDDQLRWRTAIDGVCPGCCSARVRGCTGPAVYRKFICDRCTDRVKRTMFNKGGYCVIGVIFTSFDREMGRTVIVGQKKSEPSVDLSEPTRVTRRIRSVRRTRTIKN